MKSKSFENMPTIEHQHIERCRAMADVETVRRYLGCCNCEPKKKQRYPIQCFHCLYIISSNTDASCAWILPTYGIVSGLEYQHLTQSFVSEGPRVGLGKYLRALMNTYHCAQHTLAGTTTVKVTYEMFAILSRLDSGGPFVSWSKAGALERFLWKPKAWTCARLINESSRILVLTGAGISHLTICCDFWRTWILKRDFWGTDSGIPDFRGPDGLWTKNPGAEEASDISVFLTDEKARAGYLDPKLTIRNIQTFYDFFLKLVWMQAVMSWKCISRFWSMMRMMHEANLKPNKGHRALVHLEERGKLQLLVTQKLGIWWTDYFFLTFGPFFGGYFIAFAEPQGMWMVCIKLLAVLQIWLSKCMAVPRTLSIAELQGKKFWHCRNEEKMVSGELLPELCRAPTDWRSACGCGSWKLLALLWLWWLVVPCLNFT